MIILLVSFLNSEVLAHLKVLYLSAAIFISIFCCLCSWLLVIVGLRIMLECWIVESISCLLLLHDNSILFLIVIFHLFLIFNFILLPLGLSLRVLLFTLLIRIKHLLALWCFFIVILGSLCWDLVFFCIFVSLNKLTV